MKLEGFLYLNPPSKLAIRRGMRLCTFVKGFPNIVRPCLETEAKKLLSKSVPLKSIIPLTPGTEKHETEAKDPQEVRFDLQELIFLLACYDRENRVYSGSRSKRIEEEMDASERYFWFRGRHHPAV